MATISELGSKDGILLCLGLCGYVQIIGFAKGFLPDVRHRCISVCAFRALVLVISLTAITMTAGALPETVGRLPTVVVAFASSILAVLFSEWLEWKYFAVRPHRTVLVIQLSAALFCPCGYGWLEIVLD